MIAIRAGVLRHFELLAAGKMHDPSHAGDTLRSLSDAARKELLSEIVDTTLHRVVRALDDNAEWLEVTVEGCRYGDVSEGSGVYYYWRERFGGD